VTTANSNSNAAFLELESDTDAIQQFVAHENAKTESWLIDDEFHADVNRALEILENPDSLRFVSRRGDYLYTFRQTAHNPRGLWLRRQQDQPLLPLSDWETVFDIDAYCQETGQIWVWSGAPTSQDNPERVMLGLSLDGSDRRRYAEFDCETKSFVQGGFDIPPERGGVSWLDADTLIWVTAEGPGAATSAGWARQVKHLKRGQALADAKVVFEANHDDLLADGYARRDRNGVLSEFYVRMPAIGGEVETIRRPGMPEITLPNPPDTVVAHNTTHFAYIVKEHGGVPGTLLLGEIGRDTPLRTLFEPEPRCAIDPDSLSFLEDWLIWIENENLVPCLIAQDLTSATASPQKIPLPEPGDTFWVTGLDAVHNPNDETLLLTISGITVSPRTYVFDLKKGIEGISWRKVFEQPEEFDPEGMEVKVLTATSDDGTEIPYHMVLPKGFETGNPIPVLMTGYGGFGISSNPWYAPITGALCLSKGMGYALAHIRGGAEFGPEWHLQAKGKHRHKGFEDFAAIASDLAKRGISKPELTACNGGSNGGLLCGVMLTRYPERFGAIWANVGVYDMLRFHLFTAGRGWIDEYGDPDDPEAQVWLKAYSPIHQISPASERRYPSALIDTNSHDDRVDPSHSRRFAAALQAAGHTPTFYQYGEGGHGGGGSTRETARELAMGYALLRKALGVSIGLSHLQALRND
jgi:prolyl oligopeptidase